MLKTTQMTAAKQWIAVNILPEDCCDGMSEYESTDGLERLAGARRRQAAQCARLLTASHPKREGAARLL